MGKLKDELNKQLKMAEYADDAKICIQIYNYLKKVDDGHIWSSRWSPLVRSIYLGRYPSGQTVYRPTDLGKMVVAQLNNKAVCTKS